MYYSRKRKPKIKEHNRTPDPYYAEMSNEYLPGFSIHSNNRLPVLAKFELFLRLQKIKVYSERLVDELKTFVVTEGGRPEARRGDNDDLIMALAGGLWVIEESFLQVYKGNEQADGMLSGIFLSTKSTENMNGFGNFGSNDVNARGKIKEHNERLNTIKLQNGDVMSLDWLYPIKSG